MDSQKILSDITVFGKYARYLPEINRRESWEEIISGRYLPMMVERYPHLKDEILSNGKLILEKKVLPSMRMLQFAGEPIKRNESRGYNCGFESVTDTGFFSRLMFLLLGGTGVGFSVENRNIASLPKICKPQKEKKFLVGDSIEGWADAVKALMNAYFAGGRKPRFDFGDVRKKGSRLITSGGKAPGPAPLRVCLASIQGVLESKEEGTQLESWEVADIACIIAEAVLAGGIRRAALICLFDNNDPKMLAYKTSKWFETHPFRARANISAVCFRKDIFDQFGNLVAKATTKEEFDHILKATEESNAGEPGVFWTNSIYMGTNPCAEIALWSKQFCNLTTFNFTAVKSQEDLETFARAASFFGTLQAGFSDFHYLDEGWKEHCEQDRLLGVSVTGIADGGSYDVYDWRKAAGVVLQENSRVSKEIGIKEAARTTCCKPEGTASLVVGSASGVHGRHASFYIRRSRFSTNEPIAKYLASTIPSLCVTPYSDPETVYLEMPVKSPEGSIMRTETAIETLERVKFFYENWVLPGHREGDNTHNVSCTVNVREGEWDAVRLWMWMHRSSYSGIALLPYSDHIYPFAPFEEIEEAQYLEKIKSLCDIDLNNVIEEEDTTDLTGEAACAGGKCEI